MEQINEYIYNHVTQGKYSRSYQNQLINAIKLYYKVMHDKNLENNTLPRPKNEKKLPVILSRNEIKSLIKVTLNLKHRTILILIYGTGIRLSESVNIHIKDLDFNRNLIHIHGGKGKKDRIVPFSGILQNHIKQYLESYQPKTYLFEGIKYKKYSCRSVQNILVHDKNFLTN